MCRCSPTCSCALPSNASLGAVEPSPDLATVPESVAMLRGRRKLSAVPRAIQDM